MLLLFYTKNDFCHRHVGFQSNHLTFSNALKKNCFSLKCCLSGNQRDFTLKEISFKEMHASKSLQVTFSRPTLDFNITNQY